MINITFFHDKNWKVKGYRVEYLKQGGENKVSSMLEVVINGLVAATGLALQDYKAYHLKTDTDELTEVLVMRTNKNVEAALKPFECAAKTYAGLYPEDITVRQF